MRLGSIAAMGAISGALLAGVLTQDIAFTNKPESVKAQDVIDLQFSNGQDTSDTEFLIVSSEDATASDQTFQQEVQSLKDDLQKLGSDVVAAPIFTYVDAQQQEQQLFTQDGHGALIPLTIRGAAASVIQGLQASVSAPAGFQVQLLTPGEPDDGFVETSMRVVLLESLAAKVGIAHVVQRRTYNVERVAAAGVQRQCASDRMLLEHLPELEQLQDVGRRPHRDAEAAPRKMLDESLLGK